MRGSGRGASVRWRTAARGRRSGRLQRLVPEFAQGVVAALEQLACDGQAGAVAAKPRGGVLVIRVVATARAARAAQPHRAPSAAPAGLGGSDARARGADLISG